MDKDANVRAIGRGLAVLKLVNRHRMLTVAEIARLSAIPYQTTSRIVDTLVDEGMIERDDHRKVSRPTPMVQLLSAGYGYAEGLASAGRQPIAELTRKILWPVTISSRVGGEMMVQASTHRISPKAFGDGEVGRTTPILDCPSGVVYLAFCGSAEREAILNADNCGMDPTEQAWTVAGRLSRIRANGFDCRETSHRNDAQGPLAVLSVPIFHGESCRGIVSITFLAKVHTPEAAADLYAASLMETARFIETQFAARPAPNDMMDRSAKSLPNSRKSQDRRSAQTR